MKGLNLTTTTRMRSNGYFSMIGDDLIVPTSMSNLSETYFNDRVQDFKTKPELKARVKELLKDSDSGIYFNPKWNKTLSLKDLDAMILKIADNKVGTGLAWDKLQKAKDERQNAINKLGSEWNITAKTARERVDEAIKKNYPKNNNLNNSSVQDSVKASIANIHDWVAFQTAGEAYNNEINRRIAIEQEVNKELLKGDLKKLKPLRSTIKFEDLLDKIDEEIKSIEDAQKTAEEKQKAIDEANRKLSGATTPEEKKAAQAELDALLRAGSDGAGAIARGTGLPKGAIYIGIGLVVAIGAYFMFRKKD
jgi:DNA repair exonuclease SbcCD ATPase subunit